MAARDERSEEKKEPKTLEMRVAELEDKLAQLSVTEEEAELYRKVLKAAHAVRRRGKVQRMATGDVCQAGDFCDIVPCVLCGDDLCDICEICEFCDLCLICDICVICLCAVQGQGQGQGRRSSRGLRRFGTFGR